jgi:hypothetical protein
MVIFIARPVIHTCSSVEMTVKCPFRFTECIFLVYILRFLVYIVIRYGHFHCEACNSHMQLRRDDCKVSV